MRNDGANVNSPNSPTTPVPSSPTASESTRQLKSAANMQLPATSPTPSISNSSTKSSDQPQTSVSSSSVDAIRFNSGQQSRSCSPEATGSFNFPTFDQVDKLERKHHRKIDSEIDRKLESKIDRKLERKHDSKSIKNSTNMEKADDSSEQLKLETSHHTAISAYETLYKKPHVCPNCHSKFKSKHSLVVHRLEEHNTLPEHEDDFYKCLYCPMRYIYPEQLTSHQTSKHYNLDSLFSVQDSIQDHSNSKNSLNNIHDTFHDTIKNSFQNNSKSFQDSLQKTLQELSYDSQTAKDKQQNTDNNTPDFNKLDSNSSTSGTQHKLPKLPKTPLPTLHATAEKLASKINLANSSSGNSKSRSNSGSKPESRSTTPVQKSHKSGKTSKSGTPKTSTTPKSTTPRSTTPSNLSLPCTTSSSTEYACYVCEKTPLTFPNYRSLSNHKRAHKHAHLEALVQDLVCPRCGVKELSDSICNCNSQKCILCGNKSKLLNTISTETIVQNLKKRIQNLPTDDKPTFTSARLSAEYANSQSYSKTNLPVSRRWCDACDWHFSAHKFNSHLNSHKHIHLQALADEETCPECHGNTFDLNRLICTTPNCGCIICRERNKEKAKHNRKCDVCGSFVVDWQSHKQTHKHQHMQALSESKECPKCGGTEIVYNLCNGSARRNGNITEKCACKICEAREKVLFCEVCQFSLAHTGKIKEHQRSQRHLHNLELQKARGEIGFVDKNESSGKNKGEHDLGSLLSASLLDKSLIEEINNSKVDPTSIKQEALETSTENTDIQKSIEKATEILANQISLNSQKAKSSQNPQNPQNPQNSQNPQNPETSQNSTPAGFKPAGFKPAGFVPAFNTPFTPIKSSFNLVDKLRKRLGNSESSCADSTQSEASCTDTTFCTICQQDVETDFWANHENSHKHLHLEAITNEEDCPNCGLDANVSILSLKLCSGMNMGKICNCKVCREREKVLCCKVCDMKFSNQFEAKAHKESSGHAETVERFRRSSSDSDGMPSLGEIVEKTKNFENNVEIGENGDFKPDFKPDYDFKTGFSNLASEFQQKIDSNKNKLPENIQNLDIDLNPNSDPVSNDSFPPPSFIGKFEVPDISKLSENAKILLQRQSDEERYICHLCGIEPLKFQSGSSYKSHENAHQHTHMVAFLTMSDCISCTFEETKNECRCLRASCKNCSEDLERIRKNRVWCKPCDQDIKFLKIRDHVSGHRHRHMKAIVSGVACPDCQGTEIFDFMKNNTFCEPCSQFIPKWCEHKNIHKHVHMEALWAKVPCPVCSGTEIDFNLCVNVNGKCKCRICSTREELLYCKACNIRIEYTSKVRHHREKHSHIHNQALMDGESCKICEKNVGKEEIPEVDPNSSLNPEDAKLTYCKYCDLQLKDLSKLKQHKTTHRHVHMRAISKNKKCPTCGKTEIDPTFCFNFMRSKPCNCKICRNPQTHRIPSNEVKIKDKFAEARNEAKKLKNEKNEKSEKSEKNEKNDKFNGDDKSMLGKRKLLLDECTLFQDSFGGEVLKSHNKSKNKDKRHKVQLPESGRNSTDLPTMVTRIPSPTVVYQSQLPPLPACLVYIKEEQGTESPGRAKKVYCKICQVTLKVHSSTHIKRHQSLHKHIHLNCIDSGKECSVCGGTDFDLSLCRYPNCDCRICQTRKSGKNVDNKTAITNFSQSDHKSDRSENSSPVSMKRGNGSHKGTSKSKPKRSKIVFTDSEGESDESSSEKDRGDSGMNGNQKSGGSDEDDRNTLSANFGGSLRQQQKTVQTEIRAIAKQLETRSMDLTEEEFSKLSDQLRQKEELLSIIKLANT